MLPYVCLVTDRTIRTRGNELMQCIRLEGVNSTTSEDGHLDRIGGLLAGIVAQVGTEFSFYLHLEVDDRPGVLAQVAEILGLQGVSVKSVVQKGLGGEARLVMVMHPVLESKFQAAVDLISRLDFVREPPRVIRVIEETF